MRRLILDLETDGLLNELTTIHCMGYVWDDGSDTEPSLTTDHQEMADLVNEATELVAHNGKEFDFIVLEEVLGLDLSDKVLWDTREMAALAHPDIRREDFETYRKDPSFEAKLIGSHSLRAWGVRLGDRKADYSGGWGAYTEEMGEYCRQDTSTLRTLWLHCHNWRDPDSPCAWIEPRFADFIRQVTNRGVAFDEAAAAELYSTLVGEREELRTELTHLMPVERLQMKTPEYYYLPETTTTYEKKKDAPARLRKDLIAGPLKVKEVEPNPESRTQVGLYFKSLGWKPSKFTPSGLPEINDDILRAMAVSWPEAAKFADLFALQKLMGAVSEGDNAYLKVAKNGRIHGIINHNGTPTARCTHRRPNLANPARDPRVRALFIPTPGFTLMGWDASGLELRMFCHYLNNPDYTDIVISGDIHTHHQTILGLSERDLAKVFIYAFLYGAGNQKLGSITMPKADAQLQAMTGGRLRNRFLKEIPGLAGLTAAVQERAKAQGFIYALDGRRVPCRSAHSALNALLQSAGAVVMKLVSILALDFIESRGLVVYPVLHVHDEIQFEGPEPELRVLADRMPTILREVEETLSLRVRLDGEPKFGKNWSETH